MLHIEFMSYTNTKRFGIVVKTYDFRNWLSWESHVRNLLSASNSIDQSIWDFVPTLITWFKRMSYKIPYIRNKKKIVYQIQEDVFHLKVILNPDAKTNTE